MSKITITILGTAAAIPTYDRAHSATYISYDDGEEYCLLFDCGEGTQRQFIKAHLNMMKLEDIFITHWHGDHCFGLPGMIDTMGFNGRVRPLRVFAPEARRIHSALSFSHSMANFRIIGQDVPAKLKHVTTLVETKRFSIVSSPNKHVIPSVCYALIEKDKYCIDVEKAKGFNLPEKGEIYQELKTKGEISVSGRKISLTDISIVKKGKKIVYSGDTEVCDNLCDLAQGADLLIQDCTYFEEQLPEKAHKHAALSEIIAMVQKSRIRRVILTHISRKYQDRGYLKGLIKDYPNFELAEDFMRVVI